MSFLSLFPSSVSRAQETPETQPEGMQSVSLGQAAPLPEQALPAENQKLEEELFDEFGPDLEKKTLGRK
jgi:hypothetical protein